MRWHHLRKEEKKSEEDEKSGRYVSDWLDLGRIGNSWYFFVFAKLRSEPLKVLLLSPPKSHCLSPPSLSKMVKAFTDNGVQRGLFCQVEVIEWTS